MGTELDIAGDFIYDGIHSLNQMDVINQDSLLFSFLYHVSVGLERLQKIVIVLYENFTLENYEEFEKSLITHSHAELSERIFKNTKSKLNSRENEFLQLLATFYKSARYHRFISNKILISANVKELFGKVIGSISKKYYKLIYDGCTRNNTYTYELRSGSKAQKIFLPEHRNNSLQEQKITEITEKQDSIKYRLVPAILA